MTAAVFQCRAQAREYPAESPEYRHRLPRGLSSALQALGIGCFGVMAVTHVFEKFSILPELGWGRPHSVGHFIDLVATLLGVTLVTTGFLLWRRSHRRTDVGAN